MTDKEILMLAAKAAGYTIDDVISSDEWLVINGGIPDPTLGPEAIYWNPLIDDADAFQLAVILRIAVKHTDPDAAHAGWTADYGDCPVTSDGNGPWFWKEWHKDCVDPYAATRRAIVRAAAEIGKAMA